MQEYPVVHEGTWSTCIFLFIENLIISVKKVRIYHMKQIYHMRKNLKCFLVTSCAEIRLSCGNFLHRQGAFKKYVRCGGRRSIQSKRKRTGRRGGQALCTFVLWKKILWFFKQQTRVLSDTLLGSCYKFCYFESKI